MAHTADHESDALSSSSASALYDNLRESIRVAQDWGLDAREVFEAYDEDHSGEISFKEFTYAVKELGLHYVNNSKPLRLAMTHTPFFSHATQRIKYRDLLIDCLSPETYGRLPSFADYKVRESLARIKSAVDHKGAQQVFNFFDRQDQGYIDRVSFRQGLRKMGIHLSNAETRALMRFFEKPGSPLINLSRFADVFQGGSKSGIHSDGSDPLSKLRYRVNLAVRARRTSYEYIFHLFDTDQDGFISLEELSKGFKDLGIEESIHVFTKAFTAYMDRNGRLSYDQFVRAISPEFVANPLDRLRLLIETTRRHKSITHEQVFDFFRKEKEQVLSVQDLLKAFHTLDIDTDKETVTKAFRPFFTPKTETLTFNAFVDAIQNPRRDKAMTPMQKIQLHVKQFQEKQKLSDKDMSRIVDAAAKKVSKKGVNAKGEMPFDVVVRALRDMEVKIDIAKITQAFEPFITTDGIISYVQVLRLLLPDYMSNPLELLLMLKRRRDLSDKDLFKAFDVHKKGRITLRDLQHTLAQMGSQQSLDRIKSALASYLDASQSLTFSQFKEALKDYGSVPSGGKGGEGSTHAANDALRELRRRVEETFVAHQLHINEFIKCFEDVSEGETLTIDMIVAGFDKLSIEIDGQMLSKALDGFLHANTNAISKKNFLAACLPQYHASMLKEDSRMDVTLTKLCQHILNALKRGVSLEECFKHFVMDDENKISKKAFGAGLLRLDMSLKEKEIEGVVQKFGIGSDSEFIDFEGFKTLVKTYAMEERHLEELIDQVRLIVTNAHAKGVDYINCFQHFDTDHSGLIDQDEFQSGISRLGLTLTDAQVGSILRKYGCSKKGQLGISYNNFLSILCVSGDSRKQVIAIFKRLRLRLFLVNSSVTELKKRFSQADASRSGCCSRESFLKILQQTGFRLSSDEKHTLLHYFDPKADGIVDYRHFWGLLQPKEITKILHEAVHKLRRSILEDSTFEVQRFIAAFKHFDLKGDGLITKREFRCGMHALRLKFKLSTEETEAVCDVFDFNDNSRVDSNAFVDFLLKLSGRRITELKETGDSGGGESGLEQELVEFVEMAEEMNIPLEETFKQFDPNSNGVVTFEEFQTTLYKLGFPVDAEHLRAILVRINAQESPDPTLPASREQVLYADFLSYFRRQAGLVKGGSEDEETVMKEKHKVIEACRQHAKILLSHGKRPTAAFATFDKQGTGTIPLATFKEAFRATFHPAVKASPSVVSQIAKDFMKDAHLVSYVAFLGMKQSARNSQAHESTWQKVFSKTRKRREALQVKGIAKGIIDLTLERMEQEIESKGPIWQQARRHISQRVNNATFINRNKASVAVQAKRKSKPIVASAQAQRTPKSGKKPSKSEEAKRAQALQARRKVLAAEEVAVRLIQEATVREEELAQQQQLKALEQDAVDHACKRLDNKVVFACGEKANLFLTSTGLGRFAKNDPDRKDVEFHVKDDQQLKDTIGTFSTIVARKVKRELLLLLRRNLDIGKVIRSQPDPASWSVMQAAVYIKDLGFSAKPFLDNRLDGPTLLQLTVKEATSELGLDDVMSAQSLVFCMALIHYLSQHTASKRTSIGHEPICSALRLDGTTLARPSSAPIREWTAEDVEQLISNLGLKAERFIALSIDGPALLDLSENDLTQELQLSSSNAKKVLHLIQVLRQPPWLCLGTGPYLELGVSLTGPVDQCQPFSFDQHTHCLLFPSNRDNNLFVKIRPGLKVAMDAVAAEMKEASDSLPSESSTKTVESLESQVKEHIAKVKAAGLDVEAPFLERDSLKQGSVSTSSFMEALKLTGFDISDYPAGIVLSYLETFKRGQVRYKDIIGSAEFPIELHNLVFDRDATAAPIGFTADGTVATFFNPNQKQRKTATAFVFPGAVVSVRYKGGSAKYDALVVRQNKDGTYVVEYLDKEQRSMNLEETVHQEWITVKDDSNFSVVNEAKEFKPELAVSSTSLSAGVHTWTVVIKHKSTGVSFGVCRSIRARLHRDQTKDRPFIGSDFGETTLQKGDHVRVKLDLFQLSVSLTLERDGKEIKCKTEHLSTAKLYGSIDAASRLKAKLRKKLNEVEKHTTRLSIDGRLIHVDALKQAVKKVPGCEQVEAGAIDELAGSYMHVQVAETLDLVKFLAGLRDQKQALDEASSFSPAVKLSSYGDTVQWRHEAAAETFQPDDMVLVRYAGGNTWYEAMIKSKDDNRYVVEYVESGSVEQGVIAQNMKRMETDPTSKKSAHSRLVLKLYSAMVEYTCRIKNTSGSKKASRTKGLKRQQKLSSTAREVKSFSSEGSQGATALLRQRMVTDGYVHRLESSSHFAFSPHLVRERKGTGEAGWTYLGQITYDELSRHCEYDDGLSLVVNFAENHEGAADFQRLCLMGVLYTVTSDGEELCKAPVEPLRSVLSDVRFRGKCPLAYLDKAKVVNEGSMATHFCVLSKPFRATTKQPSPPPRSLRPKARQTSRPTTRIGETKPKAAPKRTPSKATERKLFLDEVDDDEDTPQSSIGRDEEICIDRWLALNELTEFGHEADSSISYKNSPILDPVTGLRQMSRYEYIVLLHPTRPWQHIGVSNRWLPEEEEKERFEGWVKATLPEVNTDRTKTQYEVVCCLYPARPWLRRKKTWNVMQKEEAEARDRKSAKERRHRKLIRKSKRFTRFQERLNKEVAHTVETVNSTLDNLEQQERKVRILKASIDIASKEGGPKVSAEDAKKASELLAEEERLRQKAFFEAELAQEDHLQRMEKCQEKERNIREKQDFLKTKTDQLAEQEKARSWADRVTMKASQELELAHKRRQKPKIYTLEGASVLESKAKSDHQKMMYVVEKAAKEQKSWCPL